MKSYRYQQVLDKSRVGMDKELQRGLVIMAIYFTQTLGVPLEIFKDWVEKVYCKNKAEQWLVYMNFRNKYSKLFKDKKL